ncbi:MAG: hypothetical protein Q4F72_02720 [Desulfovibrionaceae bacterium]|nr:hypothetical protein [Desulfovibrionaceae bacterium]
MTRSCKILLGCCLGAAVLAGAYFAYMAWAFPEVRCEAARHLSSPEMEGDCYTCHMKATPRDAQEWYESKHGVTLVRCQTCHGMPDGNGARPFSRSPGIDVCASCHSLAIQNMEARFGKVTECNSCHPHHQSPMHGGAYQYRQPTTQTDLQ